MATYRDVRDLALVAGHPALDLVNTVEPRVPAPGPKGVGAPGDPDDPVRDHLAAPGDLLIWARRAALMGEAEVVAEQAIWRDLPDLGDDALARVTAVREALYAVLVPLAADLDQLDDEGQDAALALLGSQWRASAARSRLRPDQAGRRGFERAIGTEPGLVVLDRVAEAAVELLTTVDLELMRACPIEEGGCGWIFIDRSRGRSRRWCVMADCGARAKARRLTDRRRAARARQPAGRD